MAPSNFNKMSFLVALVVAFAAATPSATAFSFPAILPCLPFLPRIPLFPCIEPTPLKEPTECRTPLLKMLPCAGFLAINSSVAVPPSTCCEGANAIGMQGEAICYCRVVNGEIQQILPAPMNFTRMFSLTDECGLHFRLDALAEHCDGDGAPPMTLPSPPAGKPSSPPAH